MELKKFNVIVERLIQIWSKTNTATGSILPGPITRLFWLHHELK